MKILIVDDNPTNLKLLRVTLQAEGLETLEAADGQDALKILEREKIDIVISDVLMPNMDGLSFCHAVRASPQFKNIPVILYTSTYVEENDEKMAYNAGANRFIRKPAPAHVLLRAISELAQGEQSTPLVASLPTELEVMHEYNDFLVKKLEETNSELKMRLEEIQESEGKFRQLVENLQQVFFLIGPKGTPMYYISPSYEKIWGRSCESLYANPFSWTDPIHPEDRERVIGLVQNMTSNQEMEYRLVQSDNSIRWILARTFPILDKWGVAYRFCGVAEDITALKDTTKSLQESEKQFLQAQKMEAIGQLAGGVAHDFNNLITIIMGYTNILKQEMDLKNPQIADLAEIAKAAERAASLTRQLLAFSRKQILAPTVQNINTLVENIEKMLKRLIGEDVELTTRLDPALGYVKIDSGQFEQVIMNLAVNARDAMPKGGKLSIETTNAELGQENGGHVKAKPGAYVMLAVSDTGTGMDEETKMRIFEPFFTTKGQGKGTGLGLSTVHGIVKQSGGDVYVYSELGHGSVFKIYLPRVDESDRPHAPSAHSLEVPKGSETILVVEDEPAIAAIAVRVLNSLGYRVLAASTAKQALQLLEEHKEAIHLLLTDLIMPEMSGQELAERLKSLRPETVVLFMSGYMDDTALRHGILQSEVSYISKPFTPEALARKIRQVLDMKSPKNPA